VVTVSERIAAFAQDISNLPVCNTWDSVHVLEIQVWKNVLFTDFNNNNFM
jgi:hypothetical protein